MGPRVVSLAACRARKDGQVRKPRLARFCSKLEFRPQFGVPVKGTYGHRCTQQAFASVSERHSASLAETAFTLIGTLEIYNAAPREAEIYCGDSHERSEDIAELLLTPAAVAEL